MEEPPDSSDIGEFRRRFSTVDACREYLVERRWPNGKVCPRCSNTSVWFCRRRYVFECSDRKCRRQTSPTAGTIMHRPHLPIHKWFWAAYLLATHPTGISALQLQRELDIGGYHHAWHVLHRLRRGMRLNATSCLSGLVEVDETVVGQRRHGKKGPGAVTSYSPSVVVGAVEVLADHETDGTRIERAGRLRLALIPYASKKGLGKFLARTLEPASQVRMNGWSGCSVMALKDCVHLDRVIGQAPRASARPSHLHHAFANLKTWLSGTHHGVESKHLQSYLDEYAFRYNQRETPMEAFQILLGITIQEKPVTLNKLINKPD